MLGFIKVILSRLGPIALIAMGGKGEGGLEVEIYM